MYISLRDRIDFLLTNLRIVVYRFRFKFKIHKQRQLYFSVREKRFINNYESYFQVKLEKNYFQVKLETIYFQVKPNK